MIKTVILLILTVIVVPIVAIHFDQPLSVEHFELLRQLIFISLGTAVTTYIVSEITGNCSQVDKLWSIMPIVYSWFVFFNCAFNERILLMAILVTVWGVRLTYNFGRRGGYSWKFWEGEQDYRWVVLRQKSFLQSNRAWRLFNLFFISGYQSFLILLFTLPIIVALQSSETPLNLLDYFAATAFLIFVGLETIADQQQWNYQTEKHRQKSSGEPLGDKYARGFVSSGLWGKVRHPNYASEQAIWCCFYLFSVAATGRWINWSVAGVLLLMLLFQGSADFSEGISSQKYPAYEDYKKKVGRFLPKLF